MCQKISFSPPPRCKTNSRFTDKTIKKLNAQENNCKQSSEQRFPQAVQQILLINRSKHLIIRHQNYRHDGNRTRRLSNWSHERINRLKVNTAAEQTLHSRSSVNSVFERQWSTMNQPSAEMIPDFRHRGLGKLAKNGNQNQENVLRAFWQIVGSRPPMGINKKASIIYSILITIEVFFLNINSWISFDLLRSMTIITTFIH